MDEPYISLNKCSPFIFQIVNTFCTNIVIALKSTLLSSYQKIFLNPSHLNIGCGVCNEVTFLLEFRLIIKIVSTRKIVENWLKIIWLIYLFTVILLLEGIMIVIFIQNALKYIAFSSCNIVAFNEYQNKYS